MKTAIALILLLSLSCRPTGQSHYSEGEVLGARVKVAFVEARTPHGIFAGEYGDIVMMDIQSQKKYYVTDDTYFDSSPAISPDGSKLIFTSIRSSDKRMLRELGLAGPLRLYIFDSKTKSISPFAHELQRMNLDRMTLVTGLAWDPNGQKIYFSASDNKIYAVNATGDSIWTILELSADNRVNEIAPSPNGEFIAFAHQRGDLGPFGISIYAKKEHIVKQIDSCEDVLTLGGWNKESTALLFVDSTLVRLMWPSGRQERLHIKGELTEYLCSTSSFLSDTSILIVTLKPSKYSTPSQPRWDGGDLMIYDVTTKDQHWIYRADDLERGDWTIWQK